MAGICNPASSGGCMCSTSSSGLPVLASSRVCRAFDSSVVSSTLAGSSDAAAAGSVFGFEALEACVAVAAASVAVAAASCTGASEGAGSDAASAATDLTSATGASPGGGSSIGSSSCCFSHVSGATALPTLGAKVLLALTPRKWLFLVLSAVTLLSTDDTHC